MREIKCAHIENVNSLTDEYLKKLMREIDLKINYIEWRKSLSASLTPLILIVKQEHLSEIKQVMASRETKIILAFNSRKEFKLVIELKAHYSKVFGFIDLSQEVEYNIPILRNYLSSNFSNDKVNLEKLSHDLEKVYESTKNELQRIKDLHERFVKVRADKFKGAILTNKFMAGEKSGGEFFEIIHQEQELLFIQVGSASYLLSSLLLAEIEKLKETINGSNLENQSVLFQRAICHHAIENKAELNFCIMHLDLKTLQASFSVKGFGHVFYQGELINFDQPIKLNLRPKDRLFLISQGALNNWKLMTILSIKKFFLDNQTAETSELINEFFFELSRKKSSNFLIHDALLGVLEIEEKLLYQLS
jgi:hypothetical protein